MQIHNGHIHQITPSVIRQDPDGSMLLDAGEEITGMILLTAEGKDGDQVKLFYGEELDGKGSVRYDMRCNCCYREIWTLADGRCELIRMITRDSGMLRSCRTGALNCRISVFW